MPKTTNLNIGVIRRMMREKAIGVFDLGYRMGIAPATVGQILSQGEAPPELAARMAMALSTTITEISTA